MNLDYKTWAYKTYNLFITPLIILFSYLAVFYPDKRLMVLAAIPIMILLWFRLLKREWDKFLIKINHYFLNSEVKVTYSVLGGNTLLSEPELPFTKKFLRPTLGASVTYKDFGIRLNFLFFKPRINPFVIDSEYDYELIILGFENEQLTNELYNLGFKQRINPEGLKLLIDKSYDAYYLKNDEYKKNPEMLVKSIIGIITKYLKE